MKTDSSRENFVEDGCIRTLDCYEMVYGLADDAISAAARGASAELRPLLERVHDRLRDRLLRCVSIQSRGGLRPAEDVWFHGHFGWTVKAGEDEAFLGKLASFEEKPASFGRRTYLSGRCTLRGSHSLDVGSFTSIGEDLYLMTSTDFHCMDTPTTFGFHREPRDERGEWWFHQPYEQVAEAKRGISIGNDVWIARNVRIYHGAEIGDGCVVAEGSLVRGRLEPYGVYAGAPAKLKRFRFSERVIEQLRELQWWTWERERILRNAAFFNHRLTNYEGKLRALIVD